MNWLSKLLVFTIFCFSFHCYSGQNQHSVSSDSDFKKIYHYALRGEIDQVLYMLDTIDVTKLDSSQAAARAGFFSRFREKDTTQLQWTTAAEVNHIILLFRNYWNDIMLGEQDVGTADSILLELISNFLYQKHFQKLQIPVSQIREDPQKYTTEFLEVKGFHANAMGKTAHLYDLFLWKQNEVQDYAIGLITDSVTVKVNFMQDFVVTGWIEHASLGASHAGGWATKEALYATKDAYDLESEKFNVSYLSHEGQHFLDYLDFPRLKGPDLEYRAKLVELIKAEDTFNDLLELFINHAAQDASNSHSFANWKLVSSLSEELFDSEFEDALQKWEALDKIEVKTSCRKLFDRHTANLNAIGAESVEAYITTN